MGLWLIESDNDNRYHWVIAGMIGTHSLLNIIEVVTQANITVGNSPDCAIQLVGPNERV